MALFSESYVSEHSWEPTGKTESIKQKDLKKVISCRIKDKVLDDGTIIKNIVLLVQGSKPESLKLAPAQYQEQFAAGTNIDPSSIEYREFVNEDGELKWTATCEKA